MSRSISLMEVVAFSAALMLSSAGAGPSAQTSPAVLKAEDLEGDSQVLRDAYVQLHPGLYRYLTPRQFEASYAALRASLGRDRSTENAFVALTRFTASIRCGHTYPNFYNQTDALAKELFQHQDRVPFYFEWLGRRMIVTRNFSSDPRLVPGSEVLSINGTPASSILSALMSLARADGSNDAKRLDELGMRGRDRYEAFDIYFPMVFKQRSTLMKLDVRSPYGVQFRSIVPALTYEQRIAPIAKTLAATTGNGSLWSFSMLDVRTGYLKMPTWETYNSKWDWKSDIDRIFGILAGNGATKLIVDLRGNEGGTDVGNAIMAHIISTPLHLDSYHRLVRYQSVPADLRPYLNTWDNSFFDWGAAAKPYDERFFRLTKYDDDEKGDVIEPAAPRYSGKVVVLVDASNSSATFQFDDAMQKNNLGMLVGTPTGGNQRGINGGAFFFVRLPNSKIEVDLPLIGTFPVIARQDAGLTPDVQVFDTATSIANGRDPQLEAARRLP